MNQMVNYENADLSGYGQGNCDIMALALHRLTGLPLGLWAVALQDDLCEEGEFIHEYAHAVVIVDEERCISMDAWGPHQGVMPNLYFSQGRSDDAVLVAANEEDVRSAFTCCEIDEDGILFAMDLVRHAPWIAPYLRDEEQPRARSAVVG